MIAVIQRVSKGFVSIDNRIISKVNKGFVILVGIYKDDFEKDAHKLVEKISKLRIMSDNRGKMNLSIKDVKGEVLVVSQFTLCAECKKGNRPSFINAKEPKKAEKLYQLFINSLEEKKIAVKTGNFGKYMTVSIVNDGPVTIILDSKKYSNPPR